MRLRIATLLLVCLSCGAALAADKPVDVRDAMTATQFHAAGLDTLKPDQLAALNAWLAGYNHTPASATAVTAAAPAAPALAAAVAAPAAATATGKFGEEMLSPVTRGEPERIESSIPGTFTGWDGRTVFKLANGQVWQQDDTSSFDVTLQDPKVVIKHLGMGYLLTIPGHSGTVFVRRIH
jgi:hypothetical protein